jgi:hypothetical protein
LKPGGFIQWVGVETLLAEGEIQIVNHGAIRNVTCHEKPELQDRN